MCVSVIIMFGNLRTMNACVERSVLSQIHFCKTRMFGLWLPFKGIRSLEWLDLPVHKDVATEREG